MPSPNSRRTLFWTFPALALLALLSCRDGGTRRVVDDPIPDPTCGDGRVDEGEECDGSDLASQSCSTRGFNFGTLACDAQCRFVTSGCVKFCGNGKIDPGEECDGSEGPLTCSLFGYKRCGTDCKVNSSRCVSAPYVLGPAETLSNGGVGIVTDLVPKGAGDLVVAAPEQSNARISMFRYTTTMGFESPLTLRNLDEFPALPIAADLNGDGQMDLAAIDSDGTVDRYRYSTGNNVYSLESLSKPGDAGMPCAAAGWVGAVKLDEDANADLVAYACPRSLTPLVADALFVFRGGDTPTPAEVVTQAGIVASTLGDVDADGRSDLLFVTEGSAELKVLRSTPPGFTAQTARPIPSVPSTIVAADFDGDGDLDLVAVSAGQLQVLENTGPSYAVRVTESVNATSVLAADLDLDGRVDFAWVESGKVQMRRNGDQFAFTSAAINTGAGTPVWLSSGDVDEDGDPDLVATYATGGTQTVHYLLVNKVQ